MSSKKSAKGMSIEALKKKTAQRLTHDLPPHAPESQPPSQEPPQTKQKKQPKPQAKEQAAKSKPQVAQPVQQPVNPAGNPNPGGKPKAKKKKKKKGPTMTVQELKELTKQRQLNALSQGFTIGSVQPRTVLNQNQLNSNPSQANFTQQLRQMPQQQFGSNCEYGQYPDQRFALQKSKSAPESQLDSDAVDYLPSSSPNLYHQGHRTTDYSSSSFQSHPADQRFAPRFSSPSTYTSTAQDGSMGRSLSHPSQLASFAVGGGGGGGANLRTDMVISQQELSGYQAQLQQAQLQLRQAQLQLENARSKQEQYHRYSSQSVSPTPSCDNITSSGSAVSSSESKFSFPTSMWQTAVGVNDSPGQSFDHTSNDDSSFSGGSVVTWGPVHGPGCLLTQKSLSAPESADSTPPRNSQDSDPHMLSARSQSFPHERQASTLEDLLGFSDDDSNDLTDDDSDDNGDLQTGGHSQSPNPLRSIELVSTDKKSAHSFGLNQFVLSSSSASSLDGGSFLDYDEDNTDNIFSARSKSTPSRLSSLKNLCLENTDDDADKYPRSLSASSAVECLENDRIYPVQRPTCLKLNSKAGDVGSKQQRDACKATNSEFVQPSLKHLNDGPMSPKEPPCEKYSYLDLSPTDELSNSMAEFVLASPSIPASSARFFFGRGKK